MKSFIKKFLLRNRATRFLVGVAYSATRKPSLHLKTYEDYIKEKTIIGRLNNGNSIRVYSSDLKSEMYLDGSYQDVVNRIWNDNVSDFDTILDIGTNYGEFILDSVEPKDISKFKTIIAFEPNPKIANALEMSFNDNYGDASNIKLVRKGASNQNSQATFYINGHSSGGSSILKQNAYYPLHGIHRIPIEIETINVFEYLQREFPLNEPLRLAVKIDIEGYDLVVLDNILKILIAAEDLLLIVETSKSDLQNYLCQSSSKQFIELLRDKNILIYNNKKLIKIADVVDIPKILSSDMANIDILISSRVLKY